LHRTQRHTERHRARPGGLHVARPLRLAGLRRLPTGANRGHLELDTVRKVDLQSPGTHFSIPGEISAKGLSKSAADLVFAGSPLQQFMTSAFNHSALAGCTTRVINPLS
jgi:hypothetical protein